MPVGIERLRAPGYKDLLAPPLYLLEPKEKTEQQQAPNKRVGGLVLAAQRKAEALGSVATDNVSELEQPAAADQPPDA